MLWSGSYSDKSYYIVEKRTVSLFYKYLHSVLVVSDVLVPGTRYV